MINQTHQSANIFIANAVISKARRCLLIIPLLWVSIFTSTAYAGEEWGEEHIMREIAYLAKKLLDLKGGDSVTVKSPAFDKPFIGICTEVEEGGIKITCVTPGTQAAKSGLQTGDMVVRLRGKDVTKGAKDAKELYWDLVMNMKTGDKIDFVLLRSGEKKEIQVTVGALSHPGYELTVSND